MHRLLPAVHAPLPVRAALSIPPDDAFNCVYGHLCGVWARELVLRSTGFVKPNCPSPPPPGKPVACPTGVVSPVKVSLDASYEAVSQYFGGKQVVSYAESAAGCKALADWSNCQGSKNTVIHLLAHW